MPGGSGHFAYLSVGGRAALHRQLEGLYAVVYVHQSNHLFLQDVRFVPLWSVLDWVCVRYLYNVAHGHSDDNGNGEEAPHKNGPLLSVEC